MDKQNYWDKVLRKYAKHTKQPNIALINIQPDLIRLGIHILLQQEKINCFDCEETDKKLSKANITVIQLNSAHPEETGETILKINQQYPKIIVIILGDAHNYYLRMSLGKLWETDRIHGNRGHILKNQLDDHIFIEQIKSIIKYTNLNV